MDFHSDRGLDDMVCDSAGCWMCRSGDCIEYRCDATHQCPMDRECSADQRCLPGDGTGTSSCDSNDDCAVGQICTLDGQCVTSPGGGPDTSGGDTGGGDTGSGDTGGGDVDLPDHPDDVCLTNLDCGLDGTCVNGGCYFACAADGSCPPGQGCFVAGTVTPSTGAGECRPLAAPENECTFNGECGTSHACVEGTCYVQCEETLDCPAHTRCASNLCVADTTPVIQCSGAASCAEGEACIDGKCLASCEAGCGAGFECRFDHCSPVASCFDQQDCGGSDCVNGTCATP